MGEVRHPNFFIVGAPKCGTTALYEYLKRHPSVFMPWVKEPHYFADDFPKWQFCNTEAEYLRLFQKANPVQAACGEASPWYLYSKNALSNIRQRYPDAKLIIMLRHPVDIVHAQHAQNVYNLDEDQKDLVTAWELESSRRKGNDIPKSCRSVEMLFYSEFAKIGAQLQRALSIFPEEQIYCIKFEEFTSSTATVMASVEAFLGLPHVQFSAFERININRERRLMALSRFVERPPAWIDKSLAYTRGILGLESLGIYFALQKLTTVHRERQPLSKELRTTVLNAYRDDIELLATLLKRKLDDWL